MQLKSISQCRYSLTDIGLDPDSTDNQNEAAAVMDFAYTEPFRLLSDEGVEVGKSENAL